MVREGGKHVKENHSTYELDGDIDFKMNNKSQIIEEIMTLYSQDVYLLAYSFVKDQGLAEDISQEVFMKCYRNIDSFRRDASIKTWIYRITVNTSKRFVKKKSIQILKYPKFLLENLQKTESSETNFLKDNQREQLLRKVFSLPSKYREVIVLHYFNDLKINEIGETLALNVNTVKTRLMRGRSMLKDKIAFQKGDIDDE